MTADTISLDASQAEASFAPVGERLVVLAGPGAGKTEVVGARCRHLVESEQAYPEQILLISFSNAAVDVARRRTADVVDDGHGIEVVTIDSLAARIRADLEEEEPTFSSYDHSIKRATKLLRRHDSPYFDNVLHVIVDEVQDVVGVRARFVQSLLTKGVPADAGFTLLGDPMQALYDFTADQKDAGANLDLLAEATSQLGARTIELTGQYRATTADARRAADQRSELPRLTPAMQMVRLQGAMSELVPLGTLDEEAAEIIAGWRGSTALLCDTNARAALVADRLSTYGLGVEDVPRATEGALTPWIGRAFGGIGTRTVSHLEFRTAAEIERIRDVNDLWALALDMAGGQRELDLGKFASALARRAPRAFLRSPSTPITVSTVHRAKGLEFDNVVLVAPDDWIESDQETPAARRLFVALSRASTRLTVVGGLDTRGWWRERRPWGSTWIKRPPKRKGFLGFVLEPHHVSMLPLPPAGADALVGELLQWSEPDLVENVEGDLIPRWTAAAAGVPVVRTIDDFGTMMTRQAWDGHYPAFAGGRVQWLETVTGSPREAAPHGLWLGARPAGVVNANWRR